MDVKHNFTIQPTTRNIQDNLSWALNLGVNMMKQLTEPLADRMFFQFYKKYSKNYAKSWTNCTETGCKVMVISILLSLNPEPITLGDSS